LSVLVLERRPRLASLTTPVSTGAFRLQFDNREEIELVREGVELFTSFADQTGLGGWDLNLHQQGYLFASLTDATAERARRLVAEQFSWGLDDVEILTGDEARHRFPYLSPEVRHARFREADGWLDPVRLALGYAAAASTADRVPGAEGSGGAAFATGVEVLSFLREGEAVTGVRTSATDVSAPWVVVACGPFTAQVAALAELDLVIRPTRRQKLVMPDLPEIPADAPMTIEEETAAHWRPALRGCYALWTEAGTPASEPLEDVPTSSDWAFGLLDPASDHGLARLVPFWRDVWARGSDPWYLQAGQYEYTPDRRPYLGPSGINGLAINGGYSGHGIMASAGGSRVVVDVLTGRLEPSANPFAVDRPMIARDFDIL
jgi:sarcosine oxidase subunit beta